MSQPLVSVLTPTYNRRKFIPAAIACFKSQTYPMDRIEWIVLDNGTDKVSDLFAASGLKNVRYVPCPETEKLPVGTMRNRLNDLAKGEICVCMDDDDYYPPDRIRHAVNKLRSVPKRGVPVTGASHVHLFFTDRDEIWSIGPYNPNHCTNNTMAYWTTYGKENRYEDDAKLAEERYFLKDWKTPVLQTQPEETILVICHSANTFDKRILLQKKNPGMKLLNIKLKNIVKNKVQRDFYLSLAAEYKATPILVTPALDVSGTTESPA